MEQKRIYWEENLWYKGTTERYSEQKNFGAEITFWEQHLWYKGTNRRYREQNNLFLRTTTMV
jgi:hypothetical protein